MIRVLVVDDDSQTREAVREALQDEGYHVMEAPNGTTALVLLRASADRLVVLFDNVMPGLTGEGLLHVVAAEAPLRANHGYILMTASTREFTPTLSHLLTQLAVPVLWKPFELDMLFETVAQTAVRLALV